MVYISSRSSSLLSGNGCGENVAAIAQGPTEEAIDRSNDRLVVAKNKSLTINACGRTISVHEASVPRIPDLEKVLQDELGLQEQLFEVYDLTGARLATDADLREAIADGRTPLAATLSDASIHFIENRREELAQLQWKVMRDQHNQYNVKVINLSRQVGNVENAMEIAKKEQYSSNELLRQEMLNAIEVAKELFRSESRQLQEKMAAIGQLVTTERGIREVAVEQVNKSLQGIRDSIDSDRIAMNQAASRTMSQVEELRRRTEQEKLRHEQFEGQHAQDMQRLGERIDDVVQSMKSSMHEYSRGFENVSLEATQAIESHAREIRKVRTCGDQALADSTTRIALLEDRCAAFEGRLVEYQQRHSEAVERLSGRNEKVTTSLEQLRFDSGQQENTSQSFLNRIQALESQSKQSETDCREVLERDRRKREEELRLFREAIKTDHTRLQTALDGKMCERLERESTAREACCSEILEKVKEIMDARGTDSPTNKLDMLQSLSFQKQERSTTSLGTAETPVSGSLPNGTAVLAGSFTAMNSSKQGSWCASLADLGAVSSPAMSFGKHSSEVGSFTVSAPRRDGENTTTQLIAPPAWVHVPGSATSPASGIVTTPSVPGSSVAVTSTPPASGTPPFAATMQRSTSVLRRLGQPSRDVSPAPQVGQPMPTMVPSPVVFPQRYSTPSRAQSLSQSTLVSGPAAYAASSAGIPRSTTMVLTKPPVQSTAQCGLSGSVCMQRQAQ
mmetsp:Transcript_63636/g.110998  ORF Transcript_63636/g.110998 Transcript_63636/m.110998 type:complete len:734 (+) Transcript_63636:148-2349(+)